MSKRKYEHVDLLADAPPELNELLDLSKLSGAAIKKELLRRCDLGRRYLGFPEPSDERERNRQQLVVIRTFPKAFEGVSRPGPHAISELQKIELARWVDQKKAGAVRSDRAIIERGLIGRKELLSAFPWLNKRKRPPKVRRILNLVSDGRRAEKQQREYSAVLLDHFRRVALEAAGFWPGAGRDAFRQGAKNTLT